MSRERTCCLTASAAAFTLVEALCTLAIVALMMSAIFGTLRMTIHSVEGARRALKRGRVMSGIVHILRHDLDAACNVSAKKLPALVGGSTDTGGGVCLAFFSTNSLAASWTPSPSGLRRVEYIIRPSAQMPASYDLLRRETPYTIGQPTDKGRSATERLARHVSFWRLRFYDGTEWREQWRRKRLPAAVRLDVEVGEADYPAEHAQSFHFVPLVSEGVDPLP